MKRPMRERIGDFMAGKGFYIVLLLCVGTLGVSGYYLFSGLADGDRPVAGPATVVVTPAPAVTPAPPTTATPKPPVTPAPPATQAPVPTAAPEVTAPVTATASVFTWPVKGEVLRGFSVDALAYDKTMADWRAHVGVDIAAQPGTQVLAPAGGTVSDVAQDDMLGTTVTILHADGVLSTCANLAGVPAVEIGDTVRTGDVIGSVGTTAIGESAEDPHLHLSMTKDGVSVDPLEYLPQR